MLEQLWNAGFTVAAHLLNKCWRDSMGVLPDDEQSEMWFRRAAEAGHDFSQYALGKLLQSQKRMDEAVSRYEKAAAQDNSYADCRLESCTSKEKRSQRMYPGRWTTSPPPPNRATSSPSMLWAGCISTDGRFRGTRINPGTGSLRWRNRETSTPSSSWRTSMTHSPHMLLAATKLLHHLGQIFQDNSVPPAAPAGHGVDRKLLRKIRAKKIVMGHKPGDHEDLELTQGGMGGMTGY